MTLRPTRTQRLCAIVADAGGSLRRDEAMRRLAPMLGIRETRLTVGLALVAGYLHLDDADVLHLVEGTA